jgi:hypothetical protein
MHVKIVLFFTPQAPFKWLHFRSRRQKSFSFAFSLRLKTFFKTESQKEPFSLLQNLTFSILSNREVSLLLDYELTSLLLDLFLEGSLSIPYPDQATLTRNTSEPFIIPTRLYNTYKKCRSFCKISLRDIWKGCQWKIKE